MKLKFIPVRGRKPRHGVQVGELGGLKFIPVRGRKQMDTNKLLVNNVEIYPREGTETWRTRQNSTRTGVEIYPREGTETLPCFRLLSFTAVEIYPREGTET